jgi:Putative Ig domain
MRLRIPAWGTAVFVLAATSAHAATIAVPAGGDLQAALDAAQPGDVITLEPNATYTGNFVLPNKGDTSAYITIRSAAPDAVFPDAGVRMTPAYAEQLPKLKSPTLFVPAIQTAPGANHYKLMLLEFQANIDGLGDIIAIGAGDSTQTNLSQVPYAFILDRLYVHGDPEKGQKRCIALHSRDTIVTSSWVSDCKAINQDSQAISGFNGPGNWIIENNYLEAAAENFLLGGADPPIPNLVTANVVFRYNHLSKPLAWRLPILTTPADVIAAATPAAGALPAGAYYYKVVARKVGGQTRTATSIPSSEVSATLGVSGAVTISWTPVVGAQDYLVYGRTSSTQDVFWTTTNPYFTDTGDAGSAGKPASGGTKWSVKNTFELKNAQDITIEGNVFENLWVADQPGFPIVLTPRNQSGRAPWAVVQRVLFQNNIVRHTAGGVNILGTDNLAPSQLTNHITIFNNLFDDLTASTWGTSRVFQMGAGPDSITIDHNTVISTQSTMYWLYGGPKLAPTPITNLTITNNMSPHNTFGLNGNNFSTGLPAINAYTLVNGIVTGIVTGNVLAGGNSNKYPAGNFFPTVPQWQGDFVNYAAGDYHLIPTGRIGIPERPPAGPDVGADHDVITTETALALSGDIRRRRGYPEVRIITTSLPNGKYKVAYEQSVSCTGGFGPCAWEVLDSSLPAGLAFDPASGTISGTPTEAATGSLVLRAYDTAWGYNDATVILPITVDPPEFVVSIGEVPAAKVGEPFQLAVSVSGALGSVTWIVVSGDLPLGISLDAFSGVIAGTPTMWGTTTAVVQAHDSWRVDRTVARTVTITVAPTSIHIATLEIPGGAYQSKYEVALSATGGTGNTTWRIVDGQPQDGTTLSLEGVISGRPTAVGTFSLTVQASDAGWAGNVDTRAFSVTIRAREVVLYASDANMIAGTWSLVPDATAAGGLRLWNPDKTAGKIGGPLPNPANYFEIPFQAEAGVAYHVWVRGKADKDKRKNDAVIVQFSRSVNAAAAPAYRIGTTSGTYVNLADCNGCHLSGWGWQDNGWGVNVMGPEIYFEQPGAQTIRVLVKQDGFSIDQIVLSAERFLTVAPGALKNDATIVAR